MNYHFSTAILLSVMLITTVLLALTGNLQQPVPTWVWIVIGTCGPFAIISHVIDGFKYNKGENL